MRFYCVQCKRGFSESEIEKIGGSVCPFCKGPVQELKSGESDPAEMKQRSRSLTPTVPAAFMGKDRVPVRAAAKIRREEVLPDPNIFDEPTAPGGEPVQLQAELDATAPEKGGSGLDGGNIRISPVGRPRENKPSSMEMVPSPASGSASAESGGKAVPSIIPPEALGGPSRDAEPVKSRHQTVSDVFSPVGAFDPKSGKIIEHVEMVSGPKPHAVAGPDRNVAGVDALDNALDGASFGEVPLPPADSGPLELDTSKTKRFNATAESKIQTGAGTGRIAARPELLDVKKGSATSLEVPRWAKLLALVVILGLAAILVIELTGRKDEVPMRTGPTIDPLEDVAAEVARADRLMRTPHLKGGAHRVGTVGKRGKIKARRRAKRKSRTEKDSAKHASTGRSTGRAAAISYYNDGNKHLKRGEYQAAIKSYKAALRADPGFPYAHRGLGVVYATLNKRDEALEQYRLYLEKAPNAPDAASVREILKQAGQ